MSKRDNCYLCDRAAIKKCDRCGHIFCGTHIGTHSPCAQKELEEQIRLAHKRRYARVQGAAFEEHQRRSHSCFVCDNYAPKEERKLQLASYFRVEQDSHRCRGCGRIVCDLHSRITGYRGQYKTSSEELPHSVRNWTYTRVKVLRYCDKCYPSRYVGGRNGLIAIVLALGTIFGLQVWYGRGLSQSLVVGAITVFAVAMLFVLHLPRKEREFPPLTGWWRTAEPDPDERSLPAGLRPPDPASAAEEMAEPTLMRSLSEHLRLRPALRMTRATPAASQEAAQTAKYEDGDAADRMATEGS